MESPISMSLIGRYVHPSPFLFQHVHDFHRVHSKSVAQHYCYKSRDIPDMKTHSMKRPLDEEDSLYSLETSSLSDEVDLASDFFGGSASISQTSQLSESEMLKKPFFQDGIDKTFSEVVISLQIIGKKIPIKYGTEVKSY